MFLCDTLNAIVFVTRYAIFDLRHKQVFASFSVLILFDCDNIYALYLLRSRCGLRPLPISEQISSFLKGHLKVVRSDGFGVYIYVSNTLCSINLSDTERVFTVLADIVLAECINNNTMVVIFLFNLLLLWLGCCIFVLGRSRSRRYKFPILLIKDVLV